jgi:hypothetical protein
LKLVCAAGGPERFGVGMATHIVTALVKALLSGGIGWAWLKLRWQVKRLE